MSLDCARGAITSGDDGQSASALHIDSEEGTLMLIWRAAMVVHGELARHEYSVVRELEPWEEVSS